MSGEATGFVWRESPYSGATLLVHLALADVANDAHANELWMSITGIANKARVSRSTASVALRELCEGGYLELLQSGKAERKPSRYWFRTSPVSEQSESGIPESGLDKPGERPSTSPESGHVTKENSKNSTSPPVSQLENAHCVRCRGTGWYWQGQVQMGCEHIVDDEPPAPPPWIAAGTSRDEWMRAQAAVSQGSQ